MYLACPCVGLLHAGDVPALCIRQVMPWSMRAGDHGCKATATYSFKTQSLPGQPGTQNTSQPLLCTAKQNTGTASTLVRRAHPLCKAVGPEAREDRRAAFKSTVVRLLLSCCSQEDGQDDQENLSS